MSFGSRLVIALVSLVCALMFWLTALDTSGLPAGPIVFYGMAFICVIIAIACLLPKSHPITLRIIGITIFSIYALYVADSRTPKTLIQAFMGFLTFGMPSGYLAIFGTYPTWGKFVDVFQGRSPQQGHKRSSKKK